MLSIASNNLMNGMSHRDRSFRGNNQIENGCLHDELDALIDTLRYMVCGASQDVNDQLEIDQWDLALVEMDDDSTVGTFFDDDTVFSDNTTISSSSRARRAVDLIKKHASRLGVSGADLLRNPNLIKRSCNDQKRGAEISDHDYSVDLVDALLGSDIDDNDFIVDDEALHPHVASSDHHKEGGANTSLAANNVEVYLSDKYDSRGRNKLKSDLGADYLFADISEEVLPSSGKKGKNPVSKFKKHIASIRFCRQTRDPANVKDFFCDEKRASF